MSTPVLIRWPEDLLKRARARVGSRGLSAYVLDLVERDLSTVRRPTVVDQQRAPRAVAIEVPDLPRHQPTALARRAEAIVFPPRSK